MRAGAQALSLLSVPLNVHVLTALAEAPKSLIDLRRAVGSPPQTTMRKYLQALTEIGVLERHQEGDFPGKVDYELTCAGHDLLAVARVLQAWLGSSPDGSLLVGSSTSRSVIKAFVDGWSSTIVRALAAKPLTLTELSGVIKSLNYPSLERRLTAMRFASQIEPLRGGARGTPYAATSWLRAAAGPLLAGLRWEREHPREQFKPVTSRDAEAVFLLVSPILRLPPGASGSCCLAMEIPGESPDRLAGVTLQVQEGRIVSCNSRLEGRPQAWAVGSPAAWLAAMNSDAPACLELGGDTTSAKKLLEGLRSAFLLAPAPSSRSR